MNRIQPPHVSGQPDENSKSVSIRREWRTFGLVAILVLGGLCPLSAQGTKPAANGVTQLAKQLLVTPERYLITQSVWADGHLSCDTQLVVATSSVDPDPSWRLYGYVIEGLGFTAAARPPVMAVITQGQRPVVVARNQRTGELVCDRPLLRVYGDLINSWLRRATGQSGGVSSQTLMELAPESVFPMFKASPQSLQKKMQLYKTPQGELRAIEFETSPNSYEAVPNCAVTCSTRGLAVLDSDRTFVCMLQTSTKVQHEGKPRSLEFYTTIMLLDETGLAPSLPVGDITGLSAKLLGLAAPAASDDPRTEIPPELYGRVAALALMDSTAASLRAEQQSNPLPLLTVVSLVLSLDNAYTLGANMGHDLAELATGTGTFNPFDSDEKCPLGEYVVRNVAKDYAVPGADMGILDPKAYEVTVDMVAFAGRKPLDPAAEKTLWRHFGTTDRTPKWEKGSLYLMCLIRLAHDRAGLDIYDMGVNLYEAIKGTHLERKWLDCEFGSQSPQTAAPSISSPASQKEASGSTVQPHRVGHPVPSGRKTSDWHRKPDKRIQNIKCSLAAIS